MAGKGRASVNDMKRVEVQVLMEIAQQSEDNGGFYGFSRKTLAERVGVSPYRARAAIERLESEDIIEVVSRYSDDGGHGAWRVVSRGHPCRYARAGLDQGLIRRSITRRIHSRNDAAWATGRRFVSRWRNAIARKKNCVRRASRVLQ